MNKKPEQTPAQGSGQSISSAPGMQSVSPVIQRMRCSIAQLSSPLPPLYKRLLKVDKRFAHLHARPYALDLQSLSNSPAIQVSDGLTQRQESVVFSAQKQTQTKGGNAHLLAHLNPYTLVPQKPVDDAEPKATANSNTPSVNHPMVESNTASVLSQTASLTPAFMQQWINEILANNPTPSPAKSPAVTAAVAKNPHISNLKAKAPQSAGATALKTLKAGLDKASTAQLSKLAKNAGLSGTPEPQIQKNDHNLLAASHSKTTATKAPFALASTPAALPPATPSSAGPSDVASAASTGLMPSGVNLLERLLAMPDGLAATASLVNTSTSKLGFNQGSLPSGASITSPSASGMTVNRALAQLQQSLAPHSGSSQSQKLGAANQGGVGFGTGGFGPNSNSAANHSFINGVGGNNFADESERVAALVNEALVEQAIRHGVDLS